MKYNFDEQINRIGTHSYKWDLLGEKYLPLWVADMDFAIPPAVQKRLQDRIAHPVFGYLLTGNEIYDAIIGHFQRHYHVEIPNKKWIKIVPGIVPGLAAASFVGRGQSITNIPNYSCLLNAPGDAGNEMIRVPMKNENEHYSMDFDLLEKALTRDTRIFYLCNPHNPTGRVFTREELLEVSAFAKKHDLIVVSDEAHCEIVYEGEHIPFFTVDEYAKNHSITFYSNGKICNTADVILAFAVIPNPELKEEFLRYSYGFGEEHTLNVEGGIASYRDCDDWKEELLAYLKDNRDYLEEELKRRFPKVRLPHLQATYLQWAYFGEYGEHINASFFRNKAHVFFTDGEEFGDEKYIRINFGTRRAILEQALDRMEQALKEEGLL